MAKVTESPATYPPTTILPNVKGKSFLVFDFKFHERVCLFVSLVGVVSLPHVPIQCCYVGWFVFDNVFYMSFITLHLNVGNITQITHTILLLICL